jgi:hypothetical protein
VVDPLLPTGPVVVVVVGRTLTVEVVDDPEVEVVVVVVDDDVVEVEFGLVDVVVDGPGGRVVVVVAGGRVVVVVDTDVPLGMKNVPLEVLMTVPPAPGG